MYSHQYFFRWKGSAIPAALPNALLVTVIAAVITILYELTNIKLSIDSDFINVIGLVLSFLLAYRVTAAYEKYGEGFNQWTSLMASIRCMSTLIVWVNVDENDENDILEKKTALKLLLAFAVAMKHHVREEMGTHYVDIVDLIPSTMKIEQPMNEIRHGYEREPPSDYTTFMSISLYLSNYFKKIANRKKADENIISVLNDNLVKIIDCFTNIEKVTKNAQPLSYSIFISQTVWIYCLALPFQLVANSGWVSIPLIFFMAFILFCAHRIGSEIENPFGYDLNDLDLDQSCSDIKKELDILSSFQCPKFEDIVNYQNKRSGAIPDDVISNLSVKDRKNDVPIEISET
ncbi:2776_t:CDS:2 [Diversispora eburnea]|uniref:2776_t:CDS:1 n=1 Tax=Diversispora eburnea TaxID=1213867 RepID=A0A9N9CBL7_9GLOM|nr:2776_t:CDS:2 [Diversispora eburnea]